MLLKIEVKFLKMNVILSAQLHSTKVRGVQALVGLLGPFLCVYLLLSLSRCFLAVEAVDQRRKRRPEPGSSLGMQGGWRRNAWRNRGRVNNKGD
jgi:hypothetical protein